jgi:hypothetical protein
MESSEIYRQFEFVRSERTFRLLFSFYDHYEYCGKCRLPATTNVSTNRPERKLAICVSKPEYCPGHSRSSVFLSFLHVAGSCVLDTP